MAGAGARESARVHTTESVALRHAVVGRPRSGSSSSDESDIQISPRALTATGHGKGSKKSEKTRDDRAKRKKSKNLAFPFLDLPLDVVFLILLRLPYRSVVQLSRTSKRFYHICTHERLWKQFFQRNLPALAAKIDQQSDDQQPRKWWRAAAEFGRGDGQYLPAHHCLKLELLEGYLRQRRSTKSTPSVASVLLIGAPGVGKSSLVGRYMDGHFSGGVVMPPSAASDDYVFMYSRHVHLHDHDLKIAVIDFRPMFHFHPMYPYTAYCRLSATAILYDITRRETFENAQLWCQEVVKYSGCEQFPPIVIVGTHSDLREKRQVSFEQGKKLADQLRIPFLETSAVSGENVSRMFRLLIESFVLSRLHMSQPPRDLPALQTAKGPLPATSFEQLNPAESVRCAIS